MTILDRALRASSRYELVPFERLAPDERAVIEELGRDPDFYGVLRPAAGGGGTLKAVDRDTALLLLTLREPGPLPHFARRLAEGGAETDLARLVLDGVLEVGTGEEFVSGPRAADLLGSRHEAGPHDGVLARLSQEALEYAAAIDDDDLHRLSARLYGYNRIPLSARWSSRLPDAAAVAAFTGLAPGEALRNRLEREFAEDEASRSDAWLAWAHRGWGGDGGREGPRAFKLYLSPRPEAVPIALEALGAVLARRPSSRFKVGASAAGILRPDKIVAYFTRQEELLSVADGLAHRLAGTPAHGVPFTAEIAGGGLLSWGADPPGSERAIWWQPRESWRLWLTNRLAAALVAARREADARRPAWAFALDRVRLDGVDVERWMPAPGLWTDGGKGGGGLP